MSASSRSDEVQLTEIERNVLRGLERATVKHKNPSMAEIAAFTRPQVSASGVRSALKRLAGKGYVDLGPARRARGIRQLQPSPGRRT